MALVGRRLSVCRPGRSEISFPQRNYIPDSRSADPEEVVSPACRREASASVGEPLRRFPFRLWGDVCSEQTSCSSANRRRDEPYAPPAAQVGSAQTESPTGLGCAQGFNRGENPRVGTSILTKWPRCSSIGRRVSKNKNGSTTKAHSTPNIAQTTLPVARAVSHSHVRREALYSIFTGRISRRWHHLS